MYVTWVSTFSFTSPGLNWYTKLFLVNGTHSVNTLLSLLFICRAVINGKNVADTKWVSFFSINFGQNIFRFDKYLCVEVV